MRFLLVLLLTVLTGRAASYWAATNGTITGPGTSPDGPYLNVSNAFYGSWSGGSLVADDIMHFKDGTYTNFCHVAVHCNGTAGHPITFKPATNEHPKLDVWIQCFQTPGYLVYRDLEIYNSNTNRISSQSGMGLFPTDITRNTGFEAYGPEVSLINCIIHDITRLGVYWAQQSTNFLAYGNLVYNCGWVSVDSSGEHAFYGQSYDSALLKNNISFNTSGNGYQIYASAPGATEIINGVTLDGNVQWGASALSTTRNNRDFLVGCDAGAAFADNITLKNNMFYWAHGPWEFPTSQFGRDHTNGTLTVISNYWPIGWVFNQWSNVIAHDNIIATTTNLTPANYVVDFQHTNLITLASALGTWAWDTNSYYTLPSGAAFRTNAVPRTFAQWKTATGFDSQSTYVTTALPDRVTVQTNAYQLGRAHVIIYNWSLANNVSVDLSLVGLTNGSGYEVHNAQNYFAPVCLNGNYSGGSISFPMTNLSVAQATGLPTLPAPTTPEFGVFIVLPLAPFVVAPPATPAVARPGFRRRGL